MPAKIVYIERKYWKMDGWAFSIENVFREIARKLPPDKYRSSFVKIPFGNSFLEVIRNLLWFSKPAADIYHVTGQVHYMALVLPRNKTVLTIHDLGFLHLSKGLRRYILKKLFLDLPVARLKYITAVSEKTRNEILENSDCPPEKISIIENPVSDAFREGKPKAFRKQSPTILQVGITQNKNIPALLSALKGIECQLRIIGKPDEVLLADLEKSGIRYEIAFSLDDVAMKREYESADIVAFCSTYEGFGLPIIEAQSLGTAVITSNLSPLKEVSGGAAHIAEPDDPASIRAGILKLINDDEYRERLISEGLRNVARFDSAKIAENYEDLYAKVLGEQ